MAASTKEAKEQALMRLMYEYGDGIKRVCCVYLHDLPSAEDAAQETFIKAYAHLDALLDGEIQQEKAWLTRIAINTCKDALRSSWFRHIDKRRAIEDLPLCTMPAHEENLALTQAILALPDRLRELVLLHYYQDLTLRTCADILNISPATATRRLQQAQEKLRQYLERS